MGLHERGTLKVMSYALQVTAAQVHFGAPLPHSFHEMLRCKSPDQQTLRKIALEGHRFTPSELLASGLVDIVVEGGSEAVLARASELAEQWSVNACTGVWGLIKVGVYDVFRGMPTHHF
jgi:enoyl-CoA hydratase/carnithine racemase